MNIIEMETYKMKPKRISVSSKRQITIPIEYFTALKIDDEVECTIEESYEGKELLEKFKERKAKIRPAVKKLIEEADKVAEEGTVYVTIEDVFGKEK